MDNMRDGEHVDGVWITPNAEQIILYSARVSSDQTNTDPGLLRYLIRNKHWSPFELASASFEIYTSRAIGRELLRHKSFSFQEFSQRYARPRPAIIYPARKQSTNNRQSSTEPVNDQLQGWWRAVQERVADLTSEYYAKAVEAGIARECARFILPESTQTHIIMTGTLRSWIHFIEVRCDPNAQLECRYLAEAIKEELAMNLPVIAEALGWTEEEK